MSTMHGKTKTAGTTVAYKVLLLRVKQLVGEAGLAAFDRATMLCRVYDDPAFRADLVTEEAMESALDGYCCDLAVEFLELKALLEFFPSRERWGTGNLKAMRIEMMAALSESRRAAREEAVPRPHRVTKAEFDDLAKEKAKADGKVMNLSNQVETLQQATTRLETENRSLREQNAELRGRVQELERIARRELQAA